MAARRGQRVEDDGVGRLPGQTISAGFAFGVVAVAVSTGAVGTVATRDRDRVVGWGG